MRSETGVVVALEGNWVLSQLRVEPPIFTPNGDGHNNVVEFVFDVNRVLGPKEIVLTVHDLAGRHVRRLTGVYADPRGAYRVAWAGDDDGGHRVPPGTYLVHLEVGVESNRARDTARCAMVTLAC